MRRTIFCGFFLTAAGVAAWSATIAAGQVADSPRTPAAEGTREAVETVVDSNGRVRETRRFEAAAGQAARTAYVSQGGNEFVPVQIGLPEGDEELQKLRRQDVDLAHESAALLQKLGQAEGEAERAPLIKQLDEALGKQFDVQQQIRELEVTRIEAKVKKLRETMNKRAGARAAIIGNRREQLLRESEGLGWNSPDAGPTAALYPPAPVLSRPLPALRATRTGAQPERKPAGR